TTMHQTMSRRLFLPRTPPHQIWTPFPYTTLFRSKGGCKRLRESEHEGAEQGAPDRAHAAQHADREHQADVLATEGRLHRLDDDQDRKSTRLNSSHRTISYAVFCLKKKIYLPQADI